MAPVVVSPPEISSPVGGDYLGEEKVFSEVNSPEVVSSPVVGSFPVGYEVVSGCQ